MKEKLIYGGTLVGTAAGVALVFVASLGQVALANTIADYSSITTAAQDEFVGALPVVLPVIGALLAIGIVITFVMRRSRSAGK